VVFTRKDDPNTLAEDESKVNIIKRVIGLPGDTVEVRGRTVLINNEPYNEPYEVRWEEGGRDHFGPVTVPADKVLLLGDNRDKSKDSRYWGDGPFLDSDLIKGKAQVIYWSWYSWDRIGKLVR
jgi:signal peptidase I